MNRKLMIPVFVVLSMGLMMAGLVGYLSNQAKVNVGVKSPIEFRVDLLEEGSFDSDSLDFGDIYGGETITFWTKLENKAKVDIDAKLRIEIRNELKNVDCTDFTSVKLNGIEVDLDDIGQCVDAGKYIYFPGAQKLAPAGDEEDKHIDFDEIEATFNLYVAPSNYEVIAQIVQNSSVKLD